MLGLRNAATARVLVVADHHRVGIGVHPNPSPQTVFCGPRVAHVWPTCGPGSSTRLEYPPVAQPHALGHRRWRSVLRGRRSDRRLPGVAPRWFGHGSDSCDQNIRTGSVTNHLPAHTSAILSGDLADQHATAPKHDRMVRREVWPLIGPSAAFGDSATRRQ